MHVLEIIPETNTVVLGTKEELDQQTMKVRNVNLSKYATLPDGFQALTKIRYKDKGEMATINNTPTGLEVLFHSPVAAVAPGQSAVFYEGDDLVGGGFIERSIPML